MLTAGWYEDGFVPYKSFGQTGLCSTSEISPCNFSQYFLGLPLLTVIKQLSLEYAIQINQLSAILLKLIIEGLHEPVRE